jgi:hypothetical protein
MPKHNPYAPSRASMKQPEHHGPGVDVRRDGKWVVMPRDGALPPRCVKCNAQADEPIKERTLYWHHPALYILLLVSILIYAIVAVIVRKSARLSPGLCADHKKQRLNVILTGWTGVFVAFTVPFMFADSEYLGLVVSLSVLLFLVVIVYAMVRGRIVYAKRIDQDEVRLGGCGKDFLDSLPGY